MHRIRLRGPWTKTYGDPSCVVRTTVPDRLPDNREQSELASSIKIGDVICYERRFNQPTGLEVGSMVMLNISTWSGQVMDVSVNGNPIIVCGPPLEAEITGHLASHNCLRVRLASSPTALPCLDGDVALIILDPVPGSR
jgi:hypothetical protein